MTCFATVGEPGEAVFSEITQQRVLVRKPRVVIDVAGHFRAAKWDDVANGGGVFSSGKTATSMYDASGEPIGTTVDPETGDETAIYPKNKEEKYDFGNGWAVRSRGQIICTEITIKPGLEVGNGSAYNPATVDEFELQEQYPATNFYVNISEWNANAGEPRSGMIYTTQKFSGPFAVLAYVSNGNSGTGPKCVFEVGTDIEGDAVDTEWTQVGDSCILDKGQRLYQKFLRIYSGTDEVYLRTRIADGGSKAGYYDIYVLGVEPSSIVEGIEELPADKAVVRSQSVFSINGVRRQQLQRGLNIVVDQRGQVKKVLVQ